MKPSKIPEPDWMKLLVIEATWFVTMSRRTRNRKYVMDYLEEIKKTIKTVGN